jgi:hypothetical protein
LRPWQEADLSTAWFAATESTFEPTRAVYAKAADSRGRPSKSTLEKTIRLARPRHDHDGHSVHDQPRWNPRRLIMH